MTTRLTLVVALLAAALLVVAGCGGSESPSAANSTPAPVTTAGEGGDTHTDDEPDPTSGSDVLFPPTPAPQLGLQDHLGRQVTTEQFRGKAVFVTFVYASCPDVCPLIIANLRRTLDRLGPRAKDVQIIAVSVDPVGDTPKLITSYLRTQKMTGRMRWLVGSRAELEAAWTRWGIATRIPRANPDLVEHAAPIYGVDAQGNISTIYDVQVTAKEILRDIPKLLGT